MPAQKDTNVIGLVGEYRGEGHPCLRGHTVRVVSVVKRPGGDPDKGVVCSTNDELRAAGGLEHGDLIEVAPWLPAAGRWSWVTSDATLADLHDTRKER